MTGALRVMTFNIRYGTADDGPNRWEARRDVAADVLRTEAPDIVGLQEALAFQLDELADAVPGYEVIRGHAYAAKSHAAILYRAEDLSATESGCFWLSETPDAAGPPAWDARVTRCATWVRFEGFTFFNTHLDHEGDEARRRGAELLATRVRDEGPAPRIVVGDLNAGQDSEVVASLVGTGLRDVYREVHPRDLRAATYHAFRGRTIGARIDYVLCDGAWDVVDARVVRTHRDGRYPSDHYPVAAELRLRSR